MSENQETIVTGSSPVVDSSGTLYSTTDYVTPETTLASEGSVESTTPEGNQDSIVQNEQSADSNSENVGNPESSKDDEKMEDVRFDKHPRFQQLIREKNEYKQMLSELKKEIEELKQAKTENKGFDPKQLDTEKLLELQTEDPKAFLELVSKSIREQVVNEIRAEQEKMLAEKTEREKENAFIKYAEENPDVLEMWESGVLQKFLEENPHHNIISAHMYLTKENREAELKRQIEQELEKKYRERQVVRENARVLSNTPPANHNVIMPDPEISNTKKAGGLATVLARRLEAMRKQR
jgi:hypothetical protein